jgi:hypothetical protein
VFKRFLIAGLLASVLVAAPVAAADEPLPKGFEGTFELAGTHGYKIVGLIGSTGVGSEGSLSLFVKRPGASVIYQARGEVTKEHVHFDLGALGEVDVEVQPTGQMETIRPACGKPATFEGEAYVGTIVFHGEEGFTEAEATRLPLRLKPIFDLVCGAPGGLTVSRKGPPGVELKTGGGGGPRLRLDQYHPGARVKYEAKVNEVEGGLKVLRAVSGHLPAGTLTHSSSLDSATFAPRSPFSGRASYDHGNWRGSLKVDFPGRAAVPLAGPTFSASIVPTKYRVRSE